MKVLVLNCGSSSAKYSLFDMSGKEELLAGGIVERVGLPDSILKHEKTGGEKYKAIHQSPDHTAAINHILQILLHDEYGVIKDIHEIKAVGHRVVHGGETFSGSVNITKEVIDKMEECVDLAPLHNPANLKGIYAMQELLPGVPQVGVFDTSFHQTMPDYAYMYAIPYELYQKYKIRRYGFHGTSHRYIYAKAAEFLGKKKEELKIITCHLGNGASIAAVKNGVSVDTSMGLTPVEGLIMGTRCGDFDLGALFYLMDKESLNSREANQLVNKKSGMLGISGVSSDMRDVEIAAWEKKEYRSDLSLKMYFYRVKKYIGAYAAAMGGVDVIVFSAGVGENSPETREAVCEGLEFIGVDFDKEANSGLRGKLKEITKPESRVKVLVVPTNEELVIAMDTIDIVNGRV